MVRASQSACRYPYCWRPTVARFLHIYPRPLYYTDTVHTLCPGFPAIDSIWPTDKAWETCAWVDNL